MTFSQSLLKLRDQPGAGLWRKPVQIELLPLYCRQVRRVRNAQKRPVRLSTLEPQKKLLMGFRHASRYGGDQRFAYCKQFVQRHGLGVIPSKPCANSCAISLRRGTSTSAIGLS